MTPEQLTLKEAVELQRAAAEMRINRIFCYLVANVHGDLSARWGKIDEAQDLLKTHTLVGIHASSGFPILYRLVDVQKDNICDTIANGKSQNENHEI